LTWAPTSTPTSSEWLEAGYQNCSNRNDFFRPMPWRDSISRPKTQQAETIPIGHAASAVIDFYVVKNWV
jgi:hypothetical protein